MCDFAAYHVSLRVRFHLSPSFYVVKKTLKNNSFRVELSSRCGDGLYRLDQVGKWGKMVHLEDGLPGLVHPGRLTAVPPTNHPCRKENDLPNLHDYVPC